MEGEINLLPEPAFLSQINFKGDTQNLTHPLVNSLLLFYRDQMPYSFCILSVCYFLVELSFRNYFE